MVSIYYLAILPIKKLYCGLKRVSKALFWLLGLGYLTSKIFGWFKEKPQTKESFKFETTDAELYAWYEARRNRVETDGLRDIIEILVEVIPEGKLPESRDLPQYDIPRWWSPDEGFELTKTPTIVYSHSKGPYGKVCKNRISEAFVNISRSKEKPKIVFKKGLFGEGQKVALI